MTAPFLGPDFADDYRALRDDVGVVALGRDVIRVQGPDALEYLQGQCSQDIAVLTVGASADALLLTPQGKLDALIRVTRAGDDDLVVDVDGGYGEAVVARLSRFKLRVKAEITVLGWKAVALRGPEAGRVVSAAATSGTSLTIPFQWGSTSGIDLLGPDPVVAPGVRRCGLDAWESVRIETGIPVMGAELDERTIAAEAGLLERCVSFTKGCYTGQELVARLDARGNKVARHLRAVVAEGSGEGPLEVGAEVLVQDRVVGKVTSAAWSPAMGAVAGLAYLHRDVSPPSAVTIRRPDGATLGARALALPLVG